MIVLCVDYDVIVYFAIFVRNQHHDGWLANPVHSSDQWSVIDSACVLDPFNSDLNLVVDTDG